MRLFLFGCIAGMGLAAGSAWANSDLTGTVHTVNVNKTWNGIFVQLDAAPVFEPTSNCANSFAYFVIDDPFAKSFLAVLLTAKATGAPIRIMTTGCVAAPLGAVPKIEWIDYTPR